MERMVISLFFFFLFVVMNVSVTAQDWPEFRGPTGQGHSGEYKLPFEWSESRNVLWKIPVPGSGWSTPVAASGLVWVTAAINQDGASLRAVAFDIETGRERVNKEVFSIKTVRAKNLKNSLASPTPVIDGDRVYVHFGAYGTAALTTSGEIVWKNRFQYLSQHGNGGSPVIYGDLLIFSCDGYDIAFVIALDKQTGKVRWKTLRQRPISQAYSTPLVIRVGNRDEIVSVGAYRAVAYEPESGKEIWSVGYNDGFSNVPRPVYGRGLVYIMTGFFQPSLLAVRADGVGDVTETHIAWSLQRAMPLTPSPLLVRDALYVVNDRGIATCVDATTGEILWRKRLGGNYSASPVFGDGRIYFLNEEGVTTVITPGKEFVPLATNQLDGTTLASMAIASGSIFLRSNSHLYRIGVLE